jgi:sec-independent protein translocase protein TatB
MFSVPHLVIIFVVALVVFGPEKLPDLARNLGKVMGEFRRATGDLRSTFENHMRDLEREAELRKARETQAAAQTGAAATPENLMVAGVPAALPLSTPETSDAIDPASAAKDPSPDASPDSSLVPPLDLAPPAGTVQSARPNAAAFDAPGSPAPQQLNFESQQQSQPSDSTPAATDQTIDGRSRPA